MSDIVGKWEAYTLQVISRPQEGIDQALVIAGSTPRGTAYGIFELSRLMGVSPWVWWADVKPESHSEIYASAGSLTVDEPSVRFRGIFINDEDWGLEPWAAANMDTSINKTITIEDAKQVNVIDTDIEIQTHIKQMASRLGIPAYYYTQVQQEIAGLDAPYGFLAETLCSVIISVSAYVSLNDA